MFWFCAGPDQPIVWRELGGAADTGKAIAVGADPRYRRRFDVVQQLRLAGPRRPP
jgi:hypothetical protein